MDPRSHSRLNISPRRRNQQSGFILLIIFLMAASIALMMYAQLPRVAFESEREKEQLLIDRGEQYTRAIQLFYASTGGYPQSIQALEDTNNKRFLRRRYKDPYTGKDEWRLIHTNGNQLTDSLVQKPPDVNAQSGSAAATSVTQMATGTPPAQDQGPQVNATVLQRPSDVTLPRGAEGFNGRDNQQGIQQLQQQYQNALQQQQQNSQQGTTYYGQPAAQPPNGAPQGFGLPGGLPNGINLPGGLTTTGAAGFNTGVQNGQQNNNSQSSAGQNGQPAFQPQFPGQQFPGQPPPPGTNLTPGVNANQTNNGVLQQTGQNNQAGFPQQFPGQQFIGQQFPGQAPPPGFQAGANGQLLPVGNSLNPPQLQPGQQYAGQPLTGQFPTQPSPLNGGGGTGQTGAGTPGNAAIGMINQLLTQPRANPITGAASATLGTTAGGIAGVASTFKGPSIKTYKERNKYEEWEFVYTPAALGGAGVVGGRTATAANPNGTNPGGVGGGSTNPNSNPFGTGFPSPGASGGGTFGSNGTFGSSGGGVGGGGVGGGGGFQPPSSFGMPGTSNQGKQ